MYSVAIDGPAGAGKSKITTLLAQKLGWNYLDTGALYRAITVKMLDMGVDTHDPKAIAKACESIKINVKYIDGKQHTFANGEDVTPRLRTQQISNTSAQISPVKEVRANVKKLQRDLAKSQNIIVEGRDIGTVVLPESKNKFFLTASVDVRTERRAKQLEENGHIADRVAIRKEIEERDRLDSTRKLSPLTLAHDAILIDTSNLNENQVITAILSQMKFAPNSKKSTVQEPELGK